LPVPPTELAGDARSLRRAGGHLRVHRGVSVSEIGGAHAPPSALPGILPHAVGEKVRDPARTFTQIVISANTSNLGPTMRSRQ
jgi:hypothetical protein